MMRRVFPQLTWPYLARLAVIALAYFLTAKLGFIFAFTAHQVTTVWPPSGIALAVLLIWGYKYWPGVAIGAFLANVLTNEPIMVAAAIAVGNTLEAAAGAYLLRRLAGPAGTILINPRRVLLLIAAAGLSPLIAATVGTLSLLAGGVVPWAHHTVVWLVWWSGDAIGILMFTPALLVMANREYIARIRGRWLELAAVVATTYIVSTLIFTYTPGVTGAYWPFPYLVAPFLMWATLRFSQVGAIMVTLVAGLTAAWGTISGLGPFAGSGNLQQDLLFLQIFLFVDSLMALLVASVVSQQLTTERALRQRTEELNLANERMRKIVTGILDSEDMAQSKREKSSNHSGV